MGEKNSYLAKIVVVGIGGGGNNAINNMVDAGLQGGDVEFVAINTDMQALGLSSADVKLDIGRNLTHGLGAGAKPEIGREAAEESIEEIREVLEDANMVIITTGEGGGTGTGGAPVVARIARELGALVVAIVTAPFSFEGKPKALKAAAGIDELKKQVDAISIIRNDNLLALSQNKGNLSFKNAYKLADEALRQSIEGIVQIITMIGEPNVDFNDIKTVMTDSKTMIVGIGQAGGENRMIEATEQAINSPLLDVSIDGSKSVIFCAFGSEESLGLQEIAQASTMVNEAAAFDVEKIDGTYYDETLGDDVRVVVIATGFEDDTAKTITGEHKAIKKSDSISKGEDSDNDLETKADLHKQGGKFVDTPISASAPAVPADALSGYDLDIEEAISVISSSDNPRVSKPSSGFNQGLESSDTFVAGGFSSSSGLNSGSLSAISGGIPAFTGNTTGTNESKEAGTDSLELPTFLSE